MATEYLDDHQTGSSPRVRPILISGLLGFLLATASLIAALPTTDSAQHVYPFAAPIMESSNLERGRQADAARWEGMAHRWLSQNCGHSVVGSADR
jgi:hypothetical protein